MFHQLLVRVNSLICSIDIYWASTPCEVAIFVWRGNSAEESGRDRWPMGLTREWRKRVANRCGRSYQTATGVQEEKVKRSVWFQVFDNNSGYTERSYHRETLKKDLGDVGEWPWECLDRGQSNSSEQEAQRQQEGEALHVLKELTGADVAETDQGGGGKRGCGGGQGLVLTVTVRTPCAILNGVEASVGY